MDKISLALSGVVPVGDELDEAYKLIIGSKCWLSTQKWDIVPKACKNYRCLYIFLLKKMEQCDPDNWILADDQLAIIETNKDFFEKHFPKLF